MEGVLEKQINTMKRIELFLDIYKCKKVVSEDLTELQADVRVASERLHRTKEYLKIDSKEVSVQFVEIMRKMRRNELLMLHLLEVGPSNGTTSENNQSLNTATKASKEINNANPSKMHLSDYSKSPFTARSKPKVMQFYDFEAKITEEQFETAPKYLKGRMQLSELAHFLAVDIIKCFEEKYTLMYKDRKAVTNQHDLTVWKEYNHLQANFPGRSFITQEDLIRKTGKALDKKSYAKLQMLRHFHVLQEVRSEGTIYFLWVYNKQSI